MDNLKPIETVYKGYKFRSRLEARWAVFFDNAGIKYEYEPEGFQLNGVWYLPDFYLPWFHAYVEIKPSNSEDKKDAIKKLEMLFEKENVVCLYCEGDPYECNMIIYCNDSNDSSAGTEWWDAEFCEGAQFGCGGYTKHGICILVSNDNDLRDREFYDSSWDFCCLEQRSKLTDYRSMLEFEKAKARQARFEHGECG